MKRLQLVLFVICLLVFCGCNNTNHYDLYLTTTYSFPAAGETIKNVETDDYEFATCLNKMIDMLDLKIKKEKDKYQQK